MRRAPLAVLGLALGCAMLPGLRPLASTPVPVSAQANPVVYVQRAEWVGQMRPIPFSRLEWPAGHVAGGLGHDVQTGRLFATDMTAGTVRVYDPKGNLLDVIGEPGSGAEAFVAPRDVAVLANAGRDLAVSETGRRRVRIVGQDGAPRAEAAVDDPQGLIATPRGRQDGSLFFVLDRGRLVLRGFDDRGQSTLSFDLGNLGVFRAPENLASLDQGFGGRPGGTTLTQLMIADPVLGEVRGVLLFGDQGGGLGGSAVRLAGVRAVAQFLDTLPIGTQFQRMLGGAPRLGVAWLDSVAPERTTVPFDDVGDIEVTVGGDVYAAVQPDGVVHLGTGRDLIDRLTWPEGQLIEPLRIAVGDLALIADAGPRVQAWRRDGTPAFRALTPTGLPPFDVAAAGPRAYMLTQDASGGGGDAVSRLDGDQVTASWSPPAGGDHQLVALGARGGRVAALDLLGQEVWLLDEDLREVTRWSVTSANAFKGVLDLAVGTQRVFISNQQTSEVEIWTVEGAWVGAVKVPTGPLRIAAGPGDEVFVLTGSKWVFLYGPNGEPRGAWPAGRPQDRPVDLAVDDQAMLYVLDAAGQVRVYGPDAAAPAQLPPPFGPGVCSAVRDKGAGPREIMLGETVDVELVVDGVCPIDYKSADVVLVIDRSGSMREENKMVAAKNAAIAFLAQTDPLLTRVGIVSFDFEARVLQPLTADRKLLIDQVNTLTPQGGTHLVRGLGLALDVLTGVDARVDASKVVVFMSDGKHTEQGNIPIPNPPGLDEAVARARQAGVHVFTIGLGKDADEANLRRMAADEGSYFFSPTPGELRDIYVQVARRIEAAELFQSAVVTDVVPRNMRYIRGSGRPVEPEVSADEKTLVWRLADVLEPGFRLGYTLQPTQVGLWPTNVEAYNDYVDGFGNPGRQVFPVPQVRVRAPPIDTYRAFLPILIREQCTDYRLHVVLAIDTSSSMRQPFQAGGRPKIEAAREAALAFVARTDLARDVMTIVQFDTAASVVAWGSDAAVLNRAIRDLATHEGTRIDLGLATARDHLAGAGRVAGARPVVVLMTDGAPTAGSAIDTVLESQRLAAAGATLYAVAVGEDADRSFLVHLAGTERSYYAGDSDALVRLYNAMAVGITPCVRAWEMGR